MARCLRCKAGNEWIEGHVPDEPLSVQPPEVERLREALIDMVNQFAYESDTPTTNFNPVTGKVFTAEEMDAKMRASTIYTGGLSALEEAFRVLGLSDPSPRSALLDSQRTKP